MNKIQQIARKFGRTLSRKGHEIIRNSFNIKETIITAGEMRMKLAKLGNTPKVKISDNKYWLTDWDTWKDIIKVDWTDELKYRKDRFDCDNFASSFAARTAEIFNLNSAGLAIGKIYYKDTGKYYSGHVWNIIVVKDKLYHYEPIHDTFQEHSGRIQMGKWIYIVSDIEI